MADVFVLNVLLYGEPIGTLTRVTGDRTLFAFNDDYINARTRPTLSLGFKDAFGELITEFNPTQRQLLPFFSNLLPEEKLRRYLAERAGVHHEREFFLLWALGQDLPGAITVAPADGEEWPPSTDDDYGAEDSGQPEHARTNALRFSLAGVQLKFSAVEQTRGGLTIPARGVGGSWIVKLPSREFEGVPENEFSMMSLARMIGMDVPPIELIDLDTVENLPTDVDGIKGKAYAIRRFDRLSDGAAVHMEDFAQVFGVYPNDKYKKATVRRIAQVVAGESGTRDVAEFVRRVTFNVLIGNSDMHLKNWSLTYPDRVSPILAPAYDFVSTIPYFPDDTFGLKFSRTRRYDEFTEDELVHMAAKALLPGALVRDTALETVERFRQHWDVEKSNLPLSAEVARAIDAHLETVPLGRRRAQ